MIILGFILFLSFFAGLPPSPIQQDVPGYTSGPSTPLSITDSEMNGPKALSS